MPEQITGKNYLLNLYKEIDEVTHVEWDFFHNRKRKEGILFVAFKNPTLKVINSTIDKIKKYVDFDEVLLRTNDPKIKKTDYKYFIDEIPIDEFIEFKDPRLFKNLARLSEEYRESQKEILERLDELRVSESDEFYDVKEQHIKDERKEKLKIPSLIIGYIYFKSIKLD
ncbi:MAG: hypothetical protein GPJ52_01800 [Candidatus Heimdallarchaeota archaeon]|nr:hypothetical protein [Candidatus Heimdallarchaeota archaeon]